MKDLDTREDSTRFAKAIWACRHEFTGNGNKKWLVVFTDKMPSFDEHL